MLYLFNCTSGDAQKHLQSRYDEDSQIQEAVELHALDQALREPALLVDRLLTANRTAGSLQALRKQAECGEGDFTLTDRLLLKNG